MVDGFHSLPHRGIGCNWVIAINCRFPRLIGFTPCPIGASAATTHIDKRTTERVQEFHSLPHRGIGCNHPF
jgi:hypothetical protein